MRYDDPFARRAGGIKQSSEQGGPKSTEAIRAEWENRRGSFDCQMVMY
ncbi:MAG TPA: hypothetical protein VF535_05485 [Allosphingosinicella sp.]|jgi:hypothetical protein